MAQYHFITKPIPESRGSLPLYNQRNLKPGADIVYFFSKKPFPSLLGTGFFLEIDLYDMHHTESLPAH